VQDRLRFRLQARKVVEQVGDLVHQHRASLLASLGEDSANRGPEAERAIADGDDGARRPCALTSRRSECQLSVDSRKPSRAR
jgi:hypothetical protein